MKLIILFAAFHVLTEITRAIVAVRTLQDDYTDENDDVDNSKLGVALSILAVVNGLFEFLGNPVYGNLSDHSIFQFCDAEHGLYFFLELVEDQCFSGLLAYELVPAFF